MTALPRAVLREALRGIGDGHLWTLEQARRYIPCDDWRPMRELHATLSEIMEATR